jgi:hypothetical protein
MIIAKLIAPEDVNGVWASAGPLISMALNHAKGEVLIEDVKDDLVSGNARLMVFSENGQYIAAAVMVVMTYPRKRVLMVPYAGGVEMEKWAIEGMRAVERLALEMGLDSVYIVGRKGWGRVFKDSGFSEYSTIIGKELTKENLEAHHE